MGDAEDVYLKCDFASDPPERNVAYYRRSIGRRKRKVQTPSASLCVPLHNPDANHATFTSEPCAYLGLSVDQSTKPHPDLLPTCSHL